MVYIKGPADPYKPASYFLRFLHNLDTGFRLRWSQRVDRWQLERKAACAMSYITHLPQYVKRTDGAVVENDSWSRARDGYLLVRDFAPLPQFGDWTIREMQWGDPHRLGARQIEDALFQQERATKMAQKRAFDNKIEAVAKEQFQEMIWTGGERVAVPTNYNKDN